MSDEWDSDSNPIEDINRAIALLRVPPDYRVIARIETQIYDITDRLTQSGMTPREIAALYTKHGIWTEIP